MRRDHQALGPSRAVTPGTRKIDITMSAEQVSDEELRAVSLDATMAILERRDGVRHPES